jgi:Domain of unknown function (DUF4148)
MKTTSLIASLALVFAAGSALAQEATSDAWMDASMTKSRAQVQAELAQARADGSIKFASAGYMEKVQSRQSRADVTAAVYSALANGELAHINAEAADLGPQLPFTATRVAGRAR